jgi:hypothetical protein
MATTNPNDTPLSDVDLKGLQQLMLDTRMVSTHLATVTTEMKTKTRISGLPVFVSLLAVAANEAKEMLNQTTNRDENSYLATQLASRLLTLADVVLSMSPQDGK